MADPIQVLRDSLTGGHSGRTAKGLAALAQVEALVEAAQPFAEPANTNLAQFEALQAALVPFKDNT